MIAAKTDTYTNVIDEVLALTLKKRAGYSPGEDPFKNFRMSKTFGVKPEVGIMIRVMDKIARIASLMADPDADKVGESLRDTLMDAGNYCLIAVAYMDQEKMEQRDAILDDLLTDLFPTDEVYIFDSSDMEPPIDVDVPRIDPEFVYNRPEDDEYICCEKDCEGCELNCRPDSTDCNPDCSGCVAQMYNRSTAMMDNAKSRDHDSASCPVCKTIKRGVRTGD